MRINKHMRKISVIFVFTLSMLAVRTFFNSHPSEKKLPQPFDTLVIHNEEERNFQKRMQWIEEMHKSSPEVNWREKDRQSRYKKIMGYLLEKGKRANTQNNGIFGNWKEVGSKNLAGRVHTADIDLDSGEIYSGSSGGNIWKGSINGTNWSSLNDRMQMDDIKSVRVIPFNTSKRILALSRNRFFYSDDNGGKWRKANGLSDIEDGGWFIRAVVAVDQYSSIYVLGVDQDNTSWRYQITIYLSKDKGCNFTSLKHFECNNNELENFDIWTDYYQNTGLFLVENNNIHWLDNDNHFIKVSSIPLKTEGQMRLTGVKSGNTIFLYTLCYSNGKHFSDIYGSNDNGKNWSFKGTINETPFMQNSFSCSAVYPERLYMGGVNCYRSYDGGTTWEKVNEWYEYYGSESTKLHADICGINSLKNKNGNEWVLINTDGGIYISDDSLMTVNNLSLNGLDVSQYYSVYTSRVGSTYYIHAGSQDQGYQICDNERGIFQQVISGDYGHIVSGDEGRSLWMVYPTSAIYFPDIINSFGYSNWDFVGKNQYWLPPLMADPNSHNRVYLAGGTTNSGSHMFLLTYNAGNISYKELPCDFSNGSNVTIISAMAYSSINSNYRYVMTSSGNFFTSTDGGKNWKISEGFNGPYSHYFYGADIMPSSIKLGRVYIAGSGYSNSPVFISDDNGSTFSRMDNGLPGTLIYQLGATENESIIFAATELGPYAYSDAGKKWFDISLGHAPDQVYWTVDYIPSLKTARFGTYGRGIWDFTLINSSDYPEIVLNRSYLNFGVTIGRSSIPQSFTIENSGKGVLNWEVSTDSNWLSFDTTRGTNTGTVTVTASSTNLSSGTFQGEIRVTDPFATNSPQSMDVTLKVYNTGKTTIPFGEFATPANNSTVSGSIAVTGWVLDDTGVESVKLYRGEAGNLTYIGDAIFVEGARPDVEQAYPGYPMNYKAGWGYMMLTNFLPGGGNDKYKIHAVVKDAEGNQITLGTKSIYCDNVHAVKPFGAIDTPRQGGIASGKGFVNWGWVLTPLPNEIPGDGSTINIWVDGKHVGQPTYNIYREDIAMLFPGYNNSNGAIGYFYLDTTGYKNGVHTIQWTVTDNAGNNDGIGSRYFSILNSEESRSKSESNGKYQYNKDYNSIFNSPITEIPVNSIESLRIEKGTDEIAHCIEPDEMGIYSIKIKELERLEVVISDSKFVAAGFILVGAQLKPLPVGTTLCEDTGKFYWTPGPGFVGSYHFIFIERDHDNYMSRKEVIVDIRPKSTIIQH